MSKKKIFFSKEKLAVDTASVFFSFWPDIADLLMVAHVLTQCVLIISEKVALAADAFVVHLVHVRGEPF